MQEFQDGAQNSMNPRTLPSFGRTQHHLQDESWTPGAVI